MALKSTRLVRGLRTRVGAGLLGLFIGTFALTPHAQDDVRRGATTGITGLSGCGASTTVVLGNATCSANVPAATIVGSGGQTLDLSAADVTTLARGTNPQTIQFYNTLTSATNYERAGFTWAGNQFYITTAKGSGGGTNRALNFGINNAAQWQIETGNGNFQPTSTNATDLGGSSKTVRTGYFGTSVVSPLYTATGGTITTSAPVVAGTETWNASGVSFIGSTLTFTETASAAGSMYFQILGGASGTTDEFYVANGGAGFFAGTLTTNNDVLSAGDVRSGAGNQFYFNGRTQLVAPSDGILLLRNNAANDFTRLQLGGTTSSFPAIKRSSTTVAFRLADDSADAPITASNVSASGNYQVNGVLAFSATAPTFTSGFGGATGRTITGSAAVFSIVVGSSSTDNNGVLGLPTATNGWVCRAENQTSPGATDIKQSASTTSSVTLTQYNTTLGTAANFAAADIVKGTCIAY